MNCLEGSLTKLNNTIPRPEFPRPQMVRKTWMNLNGTWEFEIDQGKSGRERKLYEAEKLKDKITVPFCPESSLSGIGCKEFMESVWYRKQVTIPAECLSGNVLLHFGAVDYYTEVWINGATAGTHRGGYSSFSFDIIGLLNPGLNTITLCAEDDLRSKNQPSGKQCAQYYSNGCFYTRTTGIWQTVWLEFLPEEYIEKTKLTTDAANKAVHIETVLKGKVNGHTIKAQAFFEGRDVGTVTSKLDGVYVKITLELSEVHLWEVGCGRLYDLDISLYNNDKLVDNIKSYFGLRSIAIRENRFYLNGRPVFQRLVLDQGFYPDGIYTAPSDEALKNDIEISMKLGFNGARLHQKVFEPGYLYWADRLGYLIWGEHANWGLDVSRTENLANFLPEWLETVERDYSHPSIIGWCPFNETQPDQDTGLIRIVYKTTKLIDPSRPVIDSSGWYHVETDIEDAHDYDQNPATFKERYDALLREESVKCLHFNFNYTNRLSFISEFGGTWWSSGNQNGWGYGTNPQSEKEFIERYKGLVEALLNNPKIFAFCYTQLYDVEQEQNGLYTYCRKPKFNPEVLRKINSQKAAIEKFTSS